MHRSILLAGVAATFLAAASPAHAFRLPIDLGTVTGNPADHLESIAIDPEVYDPATHCSAKPKPGVTAMVAWLQRHSRGVFWGSYRCEMWGKHSASLHAENRAIDWHLDVTVPADRRAAKKLIDTLLAPDEDGNQHALARRMGVEELIWDCSYWGAGMSQFIKYKPCYGKSGKLRKHVDPTVGHRNHVHIGMSKRGAMRRTSFWRTAGGKKR
jgi:hypothetical protein